MDGSVDQTGGNTKFMKQVRVNGIDLKRSKAGIHNQSPTDGVVEEVQCRWYRTMFKKHSEFLWGLWYALGTQDKVMRLYGRSLD